MNRKIYRQIAKKHGVSVAEVKRDMQEAIDAAYQNPNSAAMTVPRKGAVPTPDEFIAHVAKRVQDEGGGQG